MADFTLANIPPFLIPGKFGKFEASSPLPANRAGRLHGRPGGGAISIVFVQSSKSAEGTAAIVPIAPR
jgi:hypothetical protein